MNATSVLICLASAVSLGQVKDTVFQARDLQVKQYTTRVNNQEFPFHMLLFHRTALGVNYLKPGKSADHGKPDLDFSRLATTYYHPRSPVGVALQKFNWFPGPPNTYHADARLPASMVGMALTPAAMLVNLWSEPPVAVLEVEVGTIASYARPTQQMHFIARQRTFVQLTRPAKGKPPFFHFVHDAKERGAAVRIDEGELRATFEKKGGERFYHLIVVEIYKEPDHNVLKELMTREAMKMLMSKLHDDGVLCYHTSNRYYDHVSILASVAEELDYACIVARDMQNRRDDMSAFSSEWVVVARKQKHLRHLKAPDGYAKENPRPYWFLPPRTDKYFAWTDKSEKSFRGVYLADPDIERFAQSIWEFEWSVIDIMGVAPRDAYPYMDAIAQVFRTLSDRSARRMNAGIPESARKKIEKN
jgi:hypothetical protein